MYLDEVGWQVRTDGLPGYIGAENVPVTTEARQAVVYRQLVEQAQCDPDIAEVNIFGFYDDTDLGGFQAGLNHADGTPRPSEQAVEEAIAAGCVSGRRTWQPNLGVVGAKRPIISARGDTLEVKVRAREGAVARVCVLQGVVDSVSTERALASTATSGCAKGRVSGNGPPDVEGAAKPGHGNGRGAARRGVEPAATDVRHARLALDTARRKGHASTHGRRTRVGLGTGTSPGHLTRTSVRVH